MNPHGLPYAPQTYASASSATRTLYYWKGEWCRRWDLNPHERNAHCALNAARLPVPPLRHLPPILILQAILSSVKDKILRDLNHISPLTVTAIAIWRIVRDKCCRPATRATHSGASQEKVSERYRQFDQTMFFHTTNCAHYHARHCKRPKPQPVGRQIGHGGFLSTKYPI